MNLGNKVFDVFFTLNLRLFSFYMVKRILTFEYQREKGYLYIFKYVIIKIFFSVFSFGLKSSPGLIHKQCWTFSLTLKY